MEKSKRNPAGRALFSIQFMALMLGAGRIEEADEHYQKAVRLLTDLEAALDAEKHGDAALG
jgi:flagellin-specific chaperone FliS